MDTNDKEILNASHAIDNALAKMKKKIVAKRRLTCLVWSVILTITLH